MRYALIDAAASPDIPRALAFHTQGHPARSVFARQPEAKHANSGPWLAQLDGNTSLECWLPALELNLNAVAKLESSAPFEQVFSHLEQCLDLTLPSGSMAMLRFWDGRVFLRLHGVLNEHQRRQLHGPIDAWVVKVLGRTFVSTPQGLTETTR